MSNEAQAWASKLDIVLGSSTRFVLMALANFANDDNLAWVARRTIVKYTELSLATVTRSLRDLEARGLIERTERARENGSRTTDMIRLLVGISPRSAAPPCQGDEGGTRHHDKAPSSPRSGPLVTVTSPDPSLEPSIEEESPQPPQGAGVGISNSDGEGEQGAAPAETVDTQFDVLWAQYGADPTASRAKALRAWTKLSATDRAQALALLPRFLDHCRAKSRKICDPSTYLAERRWEGLANLPAPAAKAEAARPVETDPVSRAVQWAMSGRTDERWVFVAADSEAWQAWQEAFAATGNAHRLTYGRFLTRLPDGSMARLPGRSFPMRYPPKPGAGPPGEAAAGDDEMAAFVDGGG
ncbi:helix-turn-helix domain-containing protein [Ancylobacter polymorphus]|uniref:Helix-turn-helix domain-containing protein n=1 Tax=Ancylobacter polymorphus TaxID=223390 RepID=A0A9E6ZWG1_9HYPH|nr:helix-turn-helix domain-containing protein [Ancylobacter polymorphus]UOK73001.1 helix-turn-helix domain-containing protein [Ancylobacter polymorphus]